MIPLNINVFVDAIALLDGSPLESAIFLFDDSPFCCSQGQGTPRLQTLVCPGQLVRWTLTSIDVQMLVWLSNIAFDSHACCPSAGDENMPAEEADKVAVTENALPACAMRQAAGPVWARTWEGYVPYGLPPGTAYPYQLSFEFGGLTGRVLSVGGPALVLSPGPVRADRDDSVI